MDFRNLSFVSLQPAFYLRRGWLNTEAFHYGSKDGA
jgi:hypothetical protein